MTRGVPDVAVAWTLRSWLVHVELGSPEIHRDLYWLTQQRQMLGEARFLDILREQLSEDDVQVLLRLLDDFASSVQGDTLAKARHHLVREAFQAVQHVSMCYPTIVGFKHEVVETILPAQLRDTRSALVGCANHGTGGTHLFEGDSVAVLEKALPGLILTRIAHRAAEQVCAFGKGLIRP
jgi:hypothetical protein